MEKDFKGNICLFLNIASKSLNYLLSKDINHLSTDRNRAMFPTYSWNFLAYLYCNLSIIELNSEFPSAVPI